MKIKVLIRQRPDRDNLQLYWIDPLTAKEKSRSADTTDRRQAERAAARLEEELAAGNAVGKVTWESFRQRFEDEHLTNKSRHTQKAYATAMNTFESLVGTPVDLSAINASVVSKFQAKLRGEGFPDTTISTYLGHFRGALRWAASIGLITVAPTFKLPSLGKRKFTRGRPLTLAEFQAMLKATPEVTGEDRAPEWIRLLRGLWLAGFRINEALRISWDRPPVQADLDSGNFPRVIWYAEGHKARRDEATPMVPEFAAFLRETPADQRKGLVFKPVMPGRAITTNYAGRVISDIGERAGIVVSETGKCATAHDLRRSFGTRWALKCRPVTLQALMRHATLETTLKFYVDLHCDDVGAELWGLRIGESVASRIDPSADPNVEGKIGEMIS